MEPTTDTSRRAWRIPDDRSGQRLDRCLADTLELSRSQANALLRAGAVTLDGRPATLRDKGQILLAGQQLAADCAALDPAPNGAPLAVVAEGPDWLIADKPSGLATRPLHGGQRDTLLNRVVAHRPAIVGVGEGGLRSGVVHRLDVDTSGLVLFATTAARHAEARRAFTAHTAVKRYLALVAGRVDEPRRVELGLAVTRHAPARVEVVDSEAHPNARRTALSWNPRHAGPHATLLDVALETGFLHQIRVTFAHLGHPVLGDTRYAPPAIASAADRLMLHAHHLDVGFAAADAPPPHDFHAAVEHWSYGH